MIRLADTSAWWWTERVGGELRERFRRDQITGAIATSAMVNLELLHGSRNAEDFRARREGLGHFPYCPVGEKEWAWALDVYEALAETGGAHKRSVKHPDLLIAAAAEAAGIPVLHYDQDFDRIARVTGQPVHWLAPRGSLG